MRLAVEPLHRGDRAVWALCLVFGVVAGSLLDSLDYNFDEGVYIHQARLILGGALPYTDFFYHQTPVYPFTLALAGLFAPESLFAYRLPSLVTRRDRVAGGDRLSDRTRENAEGGGLGRGLALLRGTAAVLRAARVAECVDGMSCDARCLPRLVQTAGHAPIRADRRVPGWGADRLVGALQAALRAGCNRGRLRAAGVFGPTRSRRRIHRRRDPASGWASRASFTS